MKAVTVVVAAKEPAGVVLVPGHGLMLTSLTERLGFKAWVKGDPGIWEYGKTAAEAICSMERRASSLDLKIVKIERRGKSEEMSWARA